MNIRIEELKIGKDIKKVVLLSGIRDIITMKEENVERLHHIHILDRSGSMNKSIDRLIENVKNTIDYMAEGDLISVIWFSGYDECKVLLKGATKSKDLYTLLDTLKSTVGLTCFSEPLRLANEVIDELKALCPNFSVTMFTDGCTVTPHSQEEEEKRIFEQLDIMKDNILALNTIGYGWYYQEDLLKKMAETSLFGRMIHSEDIEDYKDIWERQYKIVSECVPEKIKIDILDNDGDVLYLTRNNTKLSKNTIEMSYLDKWKNQFFVIVPENSKIKVAYKDSETIIDVDKVSTPKLRHDTVDNFLYALAYEKYYNGNTDEALDILMELKDKNMIDAQLKAFTSLERQEYQDKLQNAIYNNSYRDNTAPDNYIPADNAFCIMDLLKILASDDNYYLPTRDYNRIGVKVTDNFNLFKSKHANPGSFKDIVLNNKNLNISLRFTVDGLVKINPRQAEKHDLPSKIDSILFRNHTIIKDGRLNMDIINCKLTNKTYRELVDKIYMYNIVGTEDGGVTVVMNLKNLPIINRMYAKDKDPRNLLDVVQEINELKANMKIYKDFFKGLTEDNKVKVRSTEFTPEQMEVLREHGLNAQLQYVGVDNGAVSNDENDYYMARSLEIGVKGWSNLPKISDVVTKMENNTKMNEPTTYMAKVLGELEEIDDIPAVIQETKDRLLELSLELNTLKMAKVLTGSWWDDLELDSKGNYTFENLVIKTKYEKKYVTRG